MTLTGTAKESGSRPADGKATRRTPWTGTTRSTLKSGGRGIGEIPLTQKSKMVQLLAPFQLEVNNAYHSVKEHLKAGDFLAILEIAASGFVMNEVSEKLLGRRIAWDPIGAFKDAEETIPENEKENVQPLDRVAFHGLRQFGEAVSNMPFGNYISAFLIPEQYRQTLLGDTDPTRYGTGGDLGVSTLVKPFAAAAANSVDRVMGVADEEKMNIRNPDWQNAALQFLMPFGGKQLDRSLKAAQDMGFVPRMPWDKAGEFAPDMPAAYNNTGRFKFSIDTQDKANVAKGLLFGTNAIKEGIQYAKSGSYPLNGNDSWSVQKAYTHGVMPEKFLELSGIIQNMEPDRDGDRVLMTKKAKQEQFIMDSPDLNADQKRWLMGRFLPEDTVHRDYSSPHAFIISGLKEPQQKLWQYDSVKNAVGNNAVSYKAVFDAVSDLNDYTKQQGASPSRQEKIQAVASALNLPLYQSENIYAEIYEYKHSLEDFSEEQQAKIAKGPAASGFSEQDIIHMMNTLNHVKDSQRVEALTNAGYSLEDASDFVNTMFYCKYTREDLSEKENQILDSLKTKYNMSEDAFFNAYNLVDRIPGVKNTNGKTISGSQKKARFQALASASGWNQEGARNFLMELYGYTDKNWF